MADEKNLLLEQAQRCRRLAQAINDQEVARKLVALAEHYEAKATTVSSPPLIPGETQMANPAQKDIEGRAYQLWQTAGQPAGRDREFYLEAERQLREELVRHELKTPDNL
jgi:hypothetical protein